jgi:ADP-ribose pyrophosphatase YjhB (NUDIX family)
MGKIMGRLLQPWWRLKRGLTMGAQGAVVDAHGRVLLVRHSYRPGWHFPGGGVEWGETVMQSLLRELDEEAAIRPASPPRLHGLFTNFTSFPGDHIALFVVADFTRGDFTPNAEIEEAAFFARDDLPDETTAGTRARLAEIFDGATLSETW